MANLNPNSAASLADDIYDLRDAEFLKVFLLRPEFSGRSSAHTTKLNATVGGRVIRGATDAFGVCAPGGGRYQNDIFLIFRGTTAANNNADWISNARIGLEFSHTGSPVHLGFNQIFSSMLPAIREFLAKHGSATGTVHCIGHSLGGAIANLAADWIKKTRGGAVRLYTFGAPRVGTSWFARSMGGRVQEKYIYRVYHKTDPVPMVPVFPFTHAPISNQGYQIYSAQSIISAEAHGMAQYRQSVSGSKWKDLHGAIAPYHIDHMVEQWLGSDRRPNPADPTTWEWLNSAIVWVLKKLTMGTILIVQSSVMGLVTLADKIAWILQKGIDLSKDSGFWVLRLMRKIMQVLGMPVVKTVNELGRTFMRRILTRLMQKMNQEAQSAVRSQFSQR